MKKFDYSALSFKSLKTLKLIYQLVSLTAAAKYKKNKPHVEEKIPFHNPAALPN